MPPKLIIYAPNIHQGGGKMLLLPLIKTAKSMSSTVVISDSRLEINEEILKNLSVIKIKPSLLGRLFGEIKLKKLVRSSDIVLCFGNLPPIFKITGRVNLFIQNRYLVENRSTREFPLLSKIRIILERIWLKTFVGKAHTVIVQTNTMRDLVKATLNRDSEISPFADYYTGGMENSVSLDRNLIYDYLYVATDEPQKNHKKLIDAWVLLAKENIYPSLCLTLDNNNCKLINYIEEVKDKYKLNIKNIGYQEPNDLKEFYKISSALIYPSKFESFGLPLIEAKRMKLAIIASELDYVRDIINPDESFNPESSISISRAVKRHQGIEEEFVKIMNSQEFLKKII